MIQKLVVYISRHQQVLNPQKDVSGTHSLNFEFGSQTTVLNFGLCSQTIAVTSWICESSNISLVVLDNILYYSRNLSF